MEKKPRRRAKVKVLKTNKASDKVESEANDAQSVAKASLPEHQENGKKQPAKKKNKTKKKTSSDSSKKIKAKKKTAKAKTKTTKAKAALSTQSEVQAANPKKSADAVKEKRATSNEQERSPKSSVEMTVVNIDDRPAAKTKKKGWWSR